MYASAERQNKREREREEVDEEDPYLFSSLSLSHSYDSFLTSPLFKNSAQPFHAPCLSHFGGLSLPLSQSLSLSPMFDPYIGSLGNLACVHSLHLKDKYVCAQVSLFLRIWRVGERSIVCVCVCVRKRVRKIGSQNFR